MIIRRPEISRYGHEVQVSARVEIETPGIQAPDRLWFRFPASYGDHLTDRPEAFVVALLTSAMDLGEAVIVEGAMSPRLAYGVREYQRIMNSWWPSLRIVDVSYERIEKCQRESSGAVASAFSGGADSFYTLRMHLPQHEPLEHLRLTHGLIINGFQNDADLEDTGRFRQLSDRYASMMQRLGLDLLVVRTNAKQFRNAAMKEAVAVANGTAIASATLVLGNLISRFLLPSSAMYGEVGYYSGNHVILDHLLGTERLQIMTDGGESSRQEKLENISTWPETYTGLRVCLRRTSVDPETDSIRNCCECEKCVRTMIGLDLLGVLDRYRAFPMPLTRSNIRNVHYLGRARIWSLEANQKYARSMGRMDIVRDLQWGRLRSRMLVDPVKRFSRWKRARRH